MFQKSAARIRLDDSVLQLIARQYVLDSLEELALHDPLYKAMVLCEHGPLEKECVGRVASALGFGDSTGTAKVTANTNLRKSVPSASHTQLQSNGLHDVVTPASVRNMCMSPGMVKT